MISGHIFCDQSCYNSVSDRPAMLETRKITQPTHDSAHRCVHTATLLQQDVNVDARQKSRHYRIGTISDASTLATFNQGCVLNRTEWQMSVMDAHGTRLQQHATTQKDGIWMKDVSSLHAQKKGMRWLDQNHSSGVSAAVTQRLPSEANFQDGNRPQIAWKMMFVKWSSLWPM